MAEGGVQNGTEDHTAHATANVMKIVTSCGSDLTCNRCTVDTSRLWRGRSGRRSRHSEHSRINTATRTTSGHNQSAADNGDDNSCKYIHRFTHWLRAVTNSCCCYNYRTKTTMTTYLPLWAKTHLFLLSLAAVPNTPAWHHKLSDCLLFICSGHCFF